MAKGVCPLHADVSWFVYGDAATLPCFVCDPGAWPQLKELEHNQPYISDSVAEMVAAGHWPQPGVQGRGRSVA